MDAPRNITKNKKEKHWFKSSLFNKYLYDLEKIKQYTNKLPWEK